MAYQVILPKLTYEMERGCILEWLCEEGDQVSAGQALFVVETDKAAVEVPAEVSGTLLQVLVPAGETVPVSAPLAWIGAPGEVEAPGQTPHSPDRKEPADPETTVSPPPEVTVPLERTGGMAVSPVAKRLARELGVDLADVQAFVGPKRIREADVRAYADVRKAPAPTGAVPDEEVEFELHELTPLQQTMAAHLSQAAAIPQFTAGCEVNLANLKQLRNEMLAGWESSYGYRLTYTHLLAALVVRALESCPTLNASWTDEGIRLYRPIHLGVAMASERGLVVPVGHNAHKLSLAELAAEIVRLQQAAERNRLLPADLQGGTFTMTNVGMLGIELSMPLLNPPQSAILGIGAERTQVMLQDNKLWASPVTWITVTNDHRVVDGAAAAAFMQRLKVLIENPYPSLVG